MEKDLLAFMKTAGKDPSRLIFEDELTGLSNRRFLGHCFEHKVSWNELSSRPVSLVMLDLDHFKNINDTYGHQVGDLALMHVAGILRDVAGEEGTPIRYAGDEFMILLADRDKNAALAMGQRLVEAARSRTCCPEGVEDTLHLTFSVGVAAAPDDAASAKELIARADAALYLAKRSGRDRMADAAHVDPETTAARNALAAANKAPTAGRKGQLAQVVGYLKRFMQRESQFIVVEGTPGQGKTAFLDMVDQTLARTRIPRVRILARAHELFRPYYIAAELVLALMDRCPDKGVSALKDLSSAERDALACVLPQLAGCDRKWEDEEDDARNREMIFATLFHFIPRLGDGGPMVLFIDDMHLADEASLMLLRLMIQKKSLPLFVCASASETAEGGNDEDSTPFERFRHAYGKEIPVIRIRLTPLSEDDVSEHLALAFPGAELPAGFTREICRVSQGNPLFLSEILRKLVTDRKIRASGKGWAVDALEDGYLPRSLDEIVSQKVASLDAESRKILDTVSGYGEAVSLSLLTGSTDEREARVLDFLDQAVAQGLVSVDFTLNDENVRFLSSRVAELVYGAMESDGQRSVHERIGSYQESLHQQGLLPSAAILAYHFQRSANLEKAKLYDAIQSRHNTIVFNSSEATFYSGDPPPEDEPDTPIDAESLLLVPDLFRFFLIAIRNTKLYPTGSQLTKNAVVKLKDALDRILLANERLHLALEKKVLLVNGQELDVSEYKGTAESFATFLARLELSGIVFRKGLSEEELFRMLDAASRVDRKMIREKFWVQFAAEQELNHIILRQVRYAEMRGGVNGAPSEEEARALSEIVSEVKELSDEDFAAAANVVRNFLGAASKMKLYPPEGPVAAVAIEQVMEALRCFFERAPHLTLARVGTTILANGVRVENPDFEKLAPALLRYLNACGLKSITFLPRVGIQDFVAFFKTAAQGLPAEMNAAYWSGTAREQGIAGILFDQAVYGVMESQAKAGAASEDAATEAAPAPPASQGGSPEPEEKAGPAAPVTEQDITEAPAQIRDLFLKGEAGSTQKAIENLFSRYDSSDEPVRRSLAEAARALADAPDLAAQAPFQKLLAEPLLSAFSFETAPDLLEGLSSILLTVACNMVGVAEYNLATWVLGRCNKRRDELLESESEEDWRLGERIRLALPASTEKLLVTDASSPDPARRQAALTLMGGLGPAAVPLFLALIKDCDDSRTCQLAALWMAKAGNEAVGLFKAELAADAAPAHRVRMLDVADLVDHELGSEIVVALGDENAKVRQAAFALAERIEDPAVIDALISYVTSEDQSLAEGAIRTLGRLSAKRALPHLVDLVRTSKESRILTAACTALGRFGDPSAVEVLARILKPKGFLWFKKEQPQAVRAAAALALSGINDPGAQEILATLTDDPDPRVREAARRAFPGKA